MPKPAFSQIDSGKQTNIASTRSTTDTPHKPKTLSFGDALAHGLPENWSIVPPDAGIIRKPHK